MAENCGNCRYGTSAGPDVIACLRFPPTIMKIEGPTVTSYSPLLKLDCWCGEWRPRHGSRVENISNIQRGKSK